MSIRKIIKSSIDSDHDLLKLAKASGVKVDQIVFKQYFNRNLDYCILNMGNPGIGGTHWVVCSPKHKFYFDPLGLPAPIVVPKSYKQYDVRIQDERFGHCGDYCVLALWYLQHSSMKKMRKAFVAMPDLI